MKLYSVYDSKAQTFGVLFQAPNDVHAMRSFRMEVNRPHENNTLFHNPGDFSLHRCGAFNTETGEISPEKPEKIVDGNAVMNKPEGL